jgi:hypothetical protein
MSAPEGTCRLCLVDGKLTYEHVPPDGAGNNQKTITSRFEEWFSPTKWTGKGPQEQRGAGAHTLCGDCNSRVTGAWYVPEYIRWARAGLSLIQDIPAGCKVATIEMDGTYPLRFVKQVIAMFFSVNSLEFSRKNRDLATFVLDRDRSGLPSGYDVHLALVRGRRARSIGVAGIISNGQNYLVTEVAFPPFGLWMTIGTPSNDMGRITTFGSCEYDEQRSVKLDVLVGEVFSPYPCDYRSEADIRAARKARSDEGGKPLPAQPDDQEPAEG